MLGVVHHDRYAAVDRDGNVAAGRYVGQDRHPDDPLDVGRGEAHLGVGGVEYDQPVLLGQVEQVERVQGDAEVLQRRDVGRGQQDVHVRGVQRGQYVVGELRRG